MATRNGRIITGYAYPKIATYTNNTSTAPVALARGVDVSITAEGTDAVTFYADNGIAECISGTFTTGTLSLTIDGLKDEARNKILGITATVGDDWTDFTNEQHAPYVAFGCIVRVVEGGETHYYDVVLPKVIFKPSTLTAATQGESLEFQTETVEGTIYVNGTIWKYMSKEYDNLEDETVGETTTTGAISALTTKMTGLTLVS